MENNQNNGELKSGIKKKTFSLIAVLILAVIAVIIIVLAIQNDKTRNSEIDTITVNQNSRDNNDGDAAVNINSGEFERVELENKESAQIIVPGANPITENNVVVAKNGEPAKNDAPAMSDEAPQQTGFLLRSELPEEVFQIEIGNGVISPSSFTTQVGAPTVISLTGVDSFAHTVMFDDPSLSALFISVGPNQTKALNFNAPTEPGTYTFYCLSPGHADKGERGEMIVE